VGVESYLLTLNTNYRPVSLHLWDCSRKEKFGGLRDGYYIGASGGLLVFDLTNRLSYRSLPNWDTSIQRVCEGITAVVVGNKSDVEERKVQESEIIFPHSHGYY
jgi:GTP-binding nuclear protein Ran